MGSYRKFRLRAWPYIVPILWLSIPTFFIAMGTRISLEEVIRPMAERHFGVTIHDYSFDHTAPNQNQVVFPGDTVSIFLNQSTIQGAHKIQGAVVIVNGVRVSDVDASEYFTHTVIDWNEAISYKAKETPKLFTDVGSLTFTLPHDATLLGRMVRVSYKLEFLYPVVTGPQHFVWNSRLLSGSIDVKVRSANELRVNTFISRAILWTTAVISLMSLSFLYLLHHKTHFLDS